MARGIPAKLAGQRFGSWLVLSRAGTTESLQVLWLCQCDCGRTASVPTGNLKSGASTRCRSCGNRRGNNSRWPAKQE